MINFVKYHLKIFIITTAPFLLKNRLTASILNRAVKLLPQHGFSLRVLRFVSKIKNQNDLVREHIAVVQNKFMAHFLSSLSNYQYVFFDIYGTGDSFLLCAHMEAFCKIKGVDPSLVWIVSTRKNYSISKLFEYVGFKRYLIENYTHFSELLVELRNYKAIWREDRVIVPHVKHLAGFEFVDSFTTIPGVTDQMVMSFILTGGFNAKISMPEIEKNDFHSELIKNLQTKKIKSLILPENNSIKSVDQEFWIKLVAKLNSKGIDVYCNKAKSIPLSKQVNLDGAIPLSLEIYDLISIADEFDVVVGGQCGLTSILNQTAKKSNSIFIIPKITQENPFKFSNDITLTSSWPFLYPEKFLNRYNKSTVYELETNFSDKDVEAVLTEMEKIIKNKNDTSSDRNFNLSMSVGEMLDRLSIIQIKKEKFAGRKLMESESLYKRESNLINYYYPGAVTSSFYNDLYRLNLEAWELNDMIYQSDKSKILDEKFVYSLGLTIFKAQEINKLRISCKNMATAYFSNGSTLENKSFN